MMRPVLFVLAFCALPLGCGKNADAPRTYPVTGKVIYKGGAPLAGGSIHFTSTSDPSVRAVGEIGNDGSFTLSTLIGNQKLAGAVEGTHEVSVIPLQGADQSMPDIRLVQSQHKVEPKENHLTIEVVKGK